MPLAALNMALYRITGMENHCIAMVNHGRYNFNDKIDISRTMGWFAFPYPLKLPPVSSDMNTTMKRVKETLRQVPRDGLGASLLWLHEGKTPGLPKIFFNYQGEFEHTINLDIDAAYTDSPHDFDLELAGNVYRNKLSFSLISKLPKDKAGQFVNDFTAALEEWASG
jgi:hypothetical protein